MATTFDVIFLGTAVEIDPTEGSAVSEDAGLLVGQTYGSDVDPLHEHVHEFSPGSVGTGSSPDWYDTNNNSNADNFRIDGGPDQVMDGVATYDATITYADGSSVDVTVMLFQDTNGNLYLGPSRTEDAAQAALEAAPIESLTLNSLDSDTFAYWVPRVAGDFKEVIDGTAGGDTIGTGFTDADGSQIDGADGDADWIEGGDGADVINGGAGGDTIFAGAGDDTVTFDGGMTDPGETDSVDGGTGTDSLILDPTDNRNLTVDMNAGSVSDGTGGAELFSNIENITTGGGNDRITGDANDNVLESGAGNDTIYGGVGADTLSGGEGNDTIFGGRDSATSVGGTNTAGTSFTVIHLGSGTEVDTTEDNFANENTAGLLGTYGGVGNELYDKILEASVTDTNTNTRIDFDDETEPEPIVINGVSKLVDTGVVYNATVTFTDASTGTFSAVVFQTTDGDVYLAPETTNNADNILLTSKPIESITLDSVDVAYTNISASRLDADYALPGDIDTSADVIDGGAGDDSISGGAGADTLSGGSGADTLIGGDGQNRLYGDTGNDSLVGNATDAGSFTNMTGGAGADTFDGSVGYWDIASYYSSGSVNIDLTDGLTESGGDALGDTLTGIEQIDGSNTGDDTIRADAGLVEIKGYGGEDSLVGSSISNIMYGGDGSDYLWGDAGDDTLDGDDDFASGGADTILGGTGNDQIIGDVGDDLLDGGSGNDTIFAGDDADTIWGQTGDDQIYGEADADTIIIQDGFGNDTIVGGETITTGVDVDTLDLSAVTTPLTITITGTGAGTISDGTSTATFSQIERLVLGDNAEVVDASADTNGLEIIAAGGADSITGGSGSDTIDAGAGNDTLQASGGTDSLSGGDGNDFFDASTSAGGTDTLIGGSGNDTIQHDIKDAIVDGGDGDDYIVNVDSTGVGWITTITGGAGTDTYALDNSEGALFTSGQMIDLSIGYVTFNGALRDALSEIENIAIIDAASGAIGDAGDNVITATGNFANSLSGGAGSDSIDAGDGSDVLDGGTGNDTLVGGLGSDTIVLGDGYGGDSITGGEDGGDGDIDVLDASDITADGLDIFLSGSEDGSVTSTQGTANFVDMESFVLTGQNDTLDGRNATTAIIADGAGGDDTLLGGSGADTLTGGVGNDSIDGGIGNDSIIGGIGGDTISGGDGDDYIEGGDGDDVLRTGAGQDTLIGGEGSDTLLNSVGDDSLVGGSGDDSIVATWGADTLEGGTGNDTLIGGADDDSVVGGAGDDLIYSGTRNVPGAYSEQTGTSDSFTGTNGNSNFTGTTTSSDGQVSTFTNAGLSGYWLGNGDGVETHTHTFSQQVAGVRIDFNAINSGEYLSFEIDGIAVDLNTLIANGDATFDGANAYAIDGSGRIIETGPENNATVGTVTFLRPFTTIDVISSVDTAGSGIVYEMYVDTNPPTSSDDDFLSGGDDADTFILEDAFGNDTIVGGEGVTSGTDYDVIDMSGLSGPVTVTYDSVGAESGTITDGIDTITFSEIEHLILTDQDDSVDASNSQSGEIGDVTGINVDGRGGDDTILGGRGADTIEGGTGADSLVGDYGDDSLSGGDGNDTIYGDAADGSEIGNDTIDGGAGADFIDGGNQADSLSGGAGDDTILGGDGDDTISGGTGNDSITGGDGNDTFTYAPGDGLDTITDFNFGNTGALGDGNTANNDFIDLSGYYDGMGELRDDFDDDGILNQSNSTANGGTVDYSNNDQFSSGEGIAFQGSSRESFSADNTGVVCFAKGTMILTEKGEVPVERLRADDRIVTYDNGLQPLAMLASRRLGFDELSQNPELKPIEFRPGALGSEHRLVVSPQHMMLVRHEGGEVLVRARQLSRLKGGAVRVMHGCRQVTYFHLIFDAHQIVFANKRPAESFFPGPRALKALSDEAQHEFLMLFPDLKNLRRGESHPKRWHTARDGIRSHCLPKTVEHLGSSALL